MMICRDTFVHETQKFSSNFVFFDFLLDVLYQAPASCHSTAVTVILIFDCAPSQFFLWERLRKRVTIEKEGAQHSPPLSLERVDSTVWI